MTAPSIPLPTPRLFHVTLTYDVIVLANDANAAAMLAERKGPSEVSASCDVSELHTLPADVDTDDEPTAITRDGSIVTIEQCIAAGQAPCLRGTR